MVTSPDRDGRPRRRFTDNAVFGEVTGGSREPTFAGVLSFMRRRLSRDVAGADVVVWGVPFDAATSNRPGARFGPQAVRRASAILNGDPQFPSGIDPFEKLVVLDAGDCSFDFRHPDRVPAAIEAQAAEIIAAGPSLITLGGDHSVTLPLLRAHAATHGPLALVHFDAHQDTWNDGGGLSHSSFLAQAHAEGLVDAERSIQVGVRTVAPRGLGVEVITSHEARDLGPSGIADRSLARVGEAPAYLSFDIDVLDPAFAPGTGTPVAGGLTTIDALMTLWGIRGLDWRGMDLVEVSPPYDHADVTALAGATVVQHHLQALAVGSGAGAGAGSTHH